MNLESTKPFWLCNSNVAARHEHGYRNSEFELKEPFRGTIVASYNIIMITKCKITSVTDKERRIKSDDLQVAAVIADKNRSCHLLQILSLCIPMNKIKSWLRTEPASPWRSHSLVRIRRILLVDLHGLTSATSGRRISHQLRMAALLHAQEPEDGLLDGLADGQQTMVDEKGGFLVAEAFRDVVALFLNEDDAVEGFVKYVVLEHSWVSLLSP